MDKQRTDTYLDEQKTATTIRQNLKLIISYFDHRKKAKLSLIPALSIHPQHDG